jgi:hypothetical protein
MNRQNIIAFSTKNRGRKDTKKVIHLIDLIDEG